MKKKSIYLRHKPVYHPDRKPYVVDKVVNSIEYDPGQFLTIDQVQSLCRMPNWTVNVGKK